MSGVADEKVEVRAATDADIERILVIWAANGDEVPEGGVDILTPYLAHLMSTGRVHVADCGDLAVGFGAVVDRAGGAHLADLFVLPDRFGKGIGSQLLTASFGDATVRTTFASSDPRAMPLHVRAGMTPLWPNLYFEVDSASLPPASPTMVCEPSDAEGLAQLEQQWLGDSDIDDRGFWASLRDALRPGRRAGGRLPPCRRGRTHRQLPARPKSRSAHVARARAQIVDQDTYMTSHASLFDPTRRISDGGIL